jgi:hypothetical protein
METKIMSESLKIDFVMTRLINREDLSSSILLFPMWNISGLKNVALQILRHNYKLNIVTSSYRIWRRRAGQDLHILLRQKQAANILQRGKNRSSQYNSMNIFVACKKKWVWALIKIKALLVAELWIFVANACVKLTVSRRRSVSGPRRNDDEDDDDDEVWNKLTRRHDEYATDDSNAASESVDWGVRKYQPVKQINWVDPYLICDFQGNA